MFSAREAQWNRTNTGLALRVLKNGPEISSDETIGVGLLR